MRKGISNHLRNAGDDMRREDAAEACSEMEREQVETDGTLEVELQ